MIVRKSRRWWARSGWLGCGLVMTLISGGALAEPAPELVVGALGDLSDVDRQVLTEVLRQAGVKQVKARSVERTPERQARVMLNLAEEDLERAKSVYCDAGDEVLARFDAKATREKNLAAMLQALVDVLPKAREMGCLNRVRNDDVVSVDVAVTEVPEAQHAALVKAAESALVAKKLERFLAPPQDPQNFHFEFKRRHEVKPDKPPSDAKHKAATAN